MQNEVYVLWKKPLQLNFESRGLIAKGDHIEESRLRDKISQTVHLGIYSLYQNVHPVLNVCDSVSVFMAYSKPIFPQKGLRWRDYS